MAMNSSPKICLVGWGRFGRFLAEALSPYGIMHGISRGRIEDRNVRQIRRRELGAMDWVIPCVPISSCEGELKRIAPHVRRGSLVMDVCSVKVWPCRWMERHIPECVEILGCHPMFGPDSARAGRDDLQVVLCPLRISGRRMRQVKGIMKDLKWRIIETSPEEHDRQAAVSLSLVHFLGRALTSAGLKRQRITTLGFERLLAVNETVSNDSWRLFLDMHRFNPCSAAVRRRLIGALREMDRAIEGRAQEKRATRKGGAG